MDTKQNRLPPTNEQVVALRTLAIKYARAHGTKCLARAEDFAQEYLLAIWQGGHTSMRLQYTNYLRTLYGRIGKWGSARSKARSEAERYAVPFKELGERDWDYVRDHVTD